MKERTLCEICGEDIVKGYMTEKEGHYYCVKCLVDLNRWKNYIEILFSRKKELEEQLVEINQVIEEEKNKLKVKQKG